MKYTDWKTGLLNLFKESENVEIKVLIKGIRWDDIACRSLWQTLPTDALDN